MMSSAAIVGARVALVVTPLAGAQSPAPDAPPAAPAGSAPPATGAAPPAARAAALTQGEVRKVDRVTHKITIQHGRIANLDMPPMTMVFRVADPAMIARVSIGEKVRFRAERIGGQLTITRIERGG
jgi:Cu/Ag efflux protein CusF